MEKAYLDHEDIAKRFGCSQGMAYRIIRSIKEVNSVSPLGGALGKGKVLPSELGYWEENRGRRSTT